MISHDVQVGEIIPYGEKNAEVIQLITINLSRDAETYLATHLELPGYELGDTQEQAIQEFLLFLVDEMDWLEISEQKSGDDVRKDLEILRKYLRWVTPQGDKA